jgi:hypothetical protein
VLVRPVQFKLHDIALIIITTIIKRYNSIMESRGTNIQKGSGNRPDIIVKGTKTESAYRCSNIIT